MKNKFVVFGFIFSFLFVSSAHARDDTQYWSLYTLDLYNSKYVKLSSVEQFRLSEDMSDLGFWFSSQRASLKLHKNFHAGINYTYLESESKSPSKSEFKYQHRLELEANPQIALGDHWKIENRNRMEFRWIENKGSDNGRFRQRWRLKYKISKFNWWDHVYADSDIFVNFGKKEVDENRATPFGTQFALHKNLRLSLFYLIRSRKDDTWKSDHILGTHLKVSFS